jgi:hypothetical protein
MGEGAGGPRSGRGRGGGRGEVRRPEGRGDAGGGEGGGRTGGGEREGAGGERSSRVTSPPTRRRGHRRRRRHFNRALGLRSALSAQAKEPTRDASRSHSSAFPPPSLFCSRPPSSPSAHTPHAPHPAAADSPPSLSSSARPPRPRSTPSVRSPPPSPDLCQRPEGRREASAAAGGVRVSRRWRRHRAGRGYAASPTAAHPAPPRGLRPPSEPGSVASFCSYPPPTAAAAFPFYLSAHGGGRGC